MSGIIRVNKRGEYFTASNEPFINPRLSWEARGVMGYLLSKPDTWECRNEDLVNQGPAKSEKIERILDELQACFYVRRIKCRRPDGTFFYTTEVYESPSLNPDYQNTDLVRRLQEKRAKAADKRRRAYERKKARGVESPSGEKAKNSDKNTGGGFSGSGLSRNGESPSLVNTESLITENNDNDSYSLDSNWAAIQKIWETNIGFVAPLIVDEMQGLMAEIPPAAQVEYFKTAIAKGCAKNARNWNYIKAIIKNWIDAGGIDLNGNGKAQAETIEESPLPPTPASQPPAPLPPYAETWRQAQRLLAGGLVTKDTYTQILSHCQAQPGHNGTFVLGVPAGIPVGQVQRSSKPILRALQQIVDVTELEVITL